MKIRIKKRTTRRKSRYNKKIENELELERKTKMKHIL